jgi:hypothetical protein
VLVVADKAITDYLEDLQRVSDKKGLWNKFEKKLELEKKYKKNNNKQI